ncbi:hypothetical protein ACFFLM_12020 [Deinococcus oregonensis]|uniref:Lipoprotein n=1 Tax=Deinococcus oregonensis TaxID=1805970 RepID=A0ABV6AZ23_9DEIO
MNKVAVVVMALLPVVLSACRTEATKVDSPPSSMSVNLKKLDEIFVQRMGFKKIECPQYFISLLPKTKATIEQRCLVSPSQPEQVLLGLSEELKQLGKVEMQWRFDVGSWTSSYVSSDKRFELLVSLQSPNASEYTQQDPNVRDYGTVGTFYLEEKKPKAK